MPRIRQIALGLWVSLIVTLTVLYAVNPEWRTAETWAAVLQRSGQPVLLGYLVLSVVRPLTLVPSTVLIVVGTLLFPAQPWFVGISSLAGVVVSAAGIYYFFEFLGLAEFFERRHAARVRRLEGEVRRKGFWVVLAWSAFPFVPTDIICYVAGTLRMNLWVFLSAVALGELPIVTFYVAMGGWLLNG